jgi:FkbM family methyltransferase
LKKLLKIIYRNLIYLFYGKGISFISKVELKTKKRFEKGTLRFYGQKFRYTDAASFVSTYEEIFIKRIYQFNSKSNQPYIIDCGANIGLSVLAFKQQYPNATILAFEPDTKISSMLIENIKSLQLTNVEVVPKAVWTHEGEIHFHEQGGLSGSIIEDKNTAISTISLPSIRLKDYLNRKIDFLKIDIEGAEYEVLKDCKDALFQVDFLFIEYHSMLTSEQHLDEILSIIKNAGFRYHIQEAATSPQPFIYLHSVHGMDLQLNIYCYRS